MALIFYPAEEACANFAKMSYRDRIAILREAAEKYKDYILGQTKDQKSLCFSRPALLQVAYNWDIIAKLITDVRGMPEATDINKATKAGYLMQLSEVYAILRLAHMPKLESARLELFHEARKLSQF